MEQKDNAVESICYPVEFIKAQELFDEIYRTEWQFTEDEMNEKIYTLYSILENLYQTIQQKVDSIMNKSSFSEEFLFTSVEIKNKIKACMNFDNHVLDQAEFDWFDNSDILLLNQQLLKSHNKFKELHSSNYVNSIIKMKSTIKSNFDIIDDLIYDLLKLNANFSYKKQTS